MKANGRLALAAWCRSESGGSMSRRHAGIAEWHGVWMGDFTVSCSDWGHLWGLSHVVQQGRRRHLVREVRLTRSYNFRESLIHRRVWGDCLRHGMIGVGRRRGRGRGGRGQEWLWRGGARGRWCWEGEGGLLQGGGGGGRSGRGAGERWGRGEDWGVTGRGEGSAGGVWEVRERGGGGLSFRKGVGLCFRPARKEDKEKNRLFLESVRGLRSQGVFLSRQEF